jgi:hypothetical protein
MEVALWRGGDWKEGGMEVEMFAGWELEKILCE